MSLSRSLECFCVPEPLSLTAFTLVAIIDEYKVLISQRNWLDQTLLRVADPGRIENLILIQMVHTLHISANILHVCIHNNVFTML